MTQSIIGTKSMVVSPHYLASVAGHKILEKGKNAFDAAMAVSACLGVVYPHMTGLGGDAFWLTYEKKDGEIRASMEADAPVARLIVMHIEGKEDPFRGVRSAITVPGIVDSWDEILKECGTLTFAEVLEPAIE